jgi:hypothetical protein
VSSGSSEVLSESSESSVLIQVSGRKLSAPIQVFWWGIIYTYLSFQ